MLRASRLAILATAFLLACPGEGDDVDDTDDTDVDTDTEDTDDTEVPAAGDPVVVVDGTFSLLVGERTTLTARTVNGDDAAYTWASSDEDVATVTEDGEVHARAVGAATITATGDVTGLSGTLGVTVSVDTPYRDAWARGGHADIDAEAFNHWNDEGTVPSSCARCHTTAGLQDYMGADGSTVDVVDTDHAAGGVLECTACHNPAADSRDYVIFPSGERIEGLEGEARCMTCHQGRSSKDDVDEQIAVANVADDVISTDLSFENIHYYAAGATLLASRVRGGYEYDDEELVYDARFKHAPGMQHCNDCHDQHSLEIRFDACVDCHPGTTDVTSARNIRMLPSFGQDYNGNGNINEGMFFEVRGLKDKLLAAIGQYPPVSGGAAICYDSAAYPYWFKDNDGSGTTCDAAEAIYPNQYTEWTPRLMRAAYNYQVAAKDPGSWAHNANYIIKLLFDSITDLNGVVSGGPDMSAAVRNDPGHFNAAGDAARHWDENDTVSSSCSRCHGGADGFRFYLQYGATQETESADAGLDCHTCHENFQDFEIVDVPDVTFPSGVTANLSGDHSNVCGTCHQGRESKASVDAAIASGSLGFKNVHYLPAAATRQGADAHVGYEFDGQDYDGAWNSHPGGSGCVDCHRVTANDHSHDISREFQNTCVTGCHLTATEPGDIRSNARADVDYDGDGDGNEPLAGEIEGLVEALYTEIQTDGTTNGFPICRGDAYPYWFNDTDSSGGFCSPGEAIYPNRYTDWTPELMRATFNHQLALEEPGAWAHNFDYMAQLLIDSVDHLGGNTGGFVRPPAPASP